MKDRQTGSAPRKVRGGVVDEVTALKRQIAAMQVRLDNQADEIERLTTAAKPIKWTGTAPRQRNKS